MLVQTIDNLNRYMLERTLHGLYKCNPDKNTECSKEFCFINGGPCCHTTEEKYAMENEIRYYLKMLLEEFKDETSNFKPTYIVTAVKLPQGSIELAVNNTNIKEKIEYILDAYDENMCLKNNTNIQMQNVMIV